MMSKDFVAIAKAYADEIAKAKANDKRFGKWVRLAAKRFINDLKRAAKKKDAPFVFSEWHANKVCRFVENLPHVEGTWETKTIVLHPSDVFFLVNLFGFRKDDGTRRFTTALKAIARKNAKSTVAAAIALYCQTSEDEEGPQVVTAATTGQQARIVFTIAKRMVDKTSDLREAFGLEAFANAIASYRNGGQLRPINAKASTQDGLNPSCVVLDEIHAHKDADLLNVLRSAAGARRNPLFLFTTTEGYENAGPWGELRKFAQQVLDGSVEADHFLALYYALDDNDDDFDEACWQKANPLMEVNSILLTELRKEAIEAKQMAGKLSEFRIKRLNRQSSVAEGWINFSSWQKCAKPVDLEFLRSYPCWGGLDLASVSDLCALRLLWYVDGVYYTYGRRWVSQKAVNARKTKGLVPYQKWIDSGHIEATDGDVIDYSVIEQAIISTVETFNVKSIAYDPWNAAQLISKLKESEVPLEPFIQGPKSYNPAMKEFERAYTSGRLHYGDDPVLTWCASNITARYDANMNMAPDKKRSSDKIDDLVALLMAFGEASKEKSNEGDFNEFIFNPIGG